MAKNDCGISLDNCYSDVIMQTTMPVPQPSSKAEQAEAAFVQMLADASQRGFYGTAGMTLSVQDGRIQHIRLATERMIK